MILRKMSADTDWAWLAGFFDGEGHSSCRDRTGNSHLEKYRSPRTIVMAISQHDNDVLYRVHRITGRGKIYSITKTRPERSTLTGQYQSYSWRTGRRADLIFIGEHMWPYLGIVKKTQLAITLDLHTRLDPKGQDVLPDFVQVFKNQYPMYFNDRAGDFEKDEK